MDRRRFSLAAVASVVAVCVGMAGCTASGSQSGQVPRPAQDQPPAQVQPSAQAQLLPGLSAFMPPGDAVEYATVAAVSCTGPGDCVAGGSLEYASTAAISPGSSSYGDATYYASFVAQEHGGAWRPARAVGGLAAQSDASWGIVSLSCPSPGACVAIGEFGTGPSIVTERDGDWGARVPVPGLARLARLSASAWVQAGGLACWGAGNCLLAGTYGPVGPLTPYGGHVFWASEAGGTWSPAVPLAGPAGPPPATDAWASVACSRDGTCVIAATYARYTHTVKGGNPNVSVVTVKGRSVLVTVAGGKLGTVTQAGHGWRDAVSCAPAGGCTAVGDDDGPPAGMVAYTLHGGTWTAVAVPGLGGVASLSCVGAGTCTAFGGTGTGEEELASVESEVSGTWRPAVVLPGAASLRNAFPMLVSCADARDCVAAGYAEGAGTDPNTVFATSRSFIAVETAGAWSAVQDVPGIMALTGTRNSLLTAIACTAPGAWTGGGHYDTGLRPASWQDGAYVDSVAPFVIASAP